MPIMRAKIQLESITLRGETSSKQEQLKFHGVCKPGGYPNDGRDEDNTFALWSPSIALEMTITNPELHGKFKPNQKFYIDFTPVE